jgi:mRNA interferase HigB
MKVVGRERLHAFCEQHADARKWIENWLSEVEATTWATPQDIRQRYPSASFLHENVVILNVRGNDYRMEVTVAFKTSVLFVNWVGTHAEYDKRNDGR